MELIVSDYIARTAGAGRYTKYPDISDRAHWDYLSKELKEALGQARSYALQLGAEYSAVASQEKIWVTSVKDGYLEVIRSYTWEEIKDDDKLQELRGFIGNRAKK